MTNIETQSQEDIVEKSKNEKPPLHGRIPARYVMTAFLCLGNGVMYSHRVNMTIAIVAMVNRTSSPNVVVVDNATIYTEPSCPYPESSQETVNDDIMEGTFYWSPSLQGIVLGGFYYGYVMTQTLGGWMSQRFDAKLVYLTGTVSSSVLTLLVPIAAEYNFGLLVALRVLTGFAQGLTLPTSYNFVSRWIPSQDRSFHLALVITGSLISNIATLPIAGYLCKEGFAGGWPSAFYVFGIFGFAYSVPFYFLVYSRPTEHPRISAEELEYIRQGVPNVVQKKLPVPWSKALRSVPLWSLTFSRITTGFLFHVVSNKMPTYLDVILHYPIDQNGLLNSVIYIVQSITQISSGFLSDVVQRRNWLSTTATRKLFQSAAAIGGSVCLLCIPFAGCDGLVVVVLLVGCMGILGLCSGGEMPVIADMAPAFSGTLFGLTNSVVAVTGFVAPLIAGVFLDDHEGSIVHWSYIMYLASGLSFVGCLVFIFLAEAKLQPWADIQETQHSKSKVAGPEKDLEKY